MQIVKNTTILFEPDKGLTSVSNLAMYRGSVEDNICISDAQYYELSAQQNLWCEILEF